MSETQNKLLKAQATKNGLQAGSIVSGITYVWMVLEVLSGWPWWAKGLLILVGIVGLSAVFYVIWRLNTAQVKDLADKFKIVGQALAELLSLFLPFTKTDDVVTPVTPVWPGVVVVGYKAYVTVDEFKGETRKAAVPDDALTIIATKNGKSWEERQAGFRDGVIYSLVGEDWWKDEIVPDYDEAKFNDKIRAAWHKVVELNGAILYKDNRYGYEVYDIALLREIEAYLAASEGLTLEAFVEKYSRGA